MQNYKLEFITKHISRDNFSNMQIYEFLYNEYEKSLLKFERNINIFGIYFFDILKVATHINLKIREIENNLLIEELDQENLKKFPYYNTQDINNGIKIEDKDFGKEILLKNHVPNLKDILIYLFNLKNFFFNKKNVISTCELKIDNDKLLFLNSKNKNNFYLFDYINGKNKYKIPLLINQLSFLKDALIKLEKNFFFNYNNLNISKTIEHHILANCEEGTEKLKVKSKYLIIGSGVELKNRIISSIFRQNKKKIIQIVHGDSYGVYDDPVWSKLGDQYNADFILGYGHGYEKFKNKNIFTINNEAKYLSGSSHDIIKLKQKKYKKIKNNLKFAYFPTIFSGISKRYGPYRDMPDKLYISWQNKINTTFKKNLIFKIHPKEKLSYLYSNDIKIKEGNIQNYFNEYNVLIFDHISTAFNLACSTKNWIIFFDLGTRQLNYKALNKIKKRVLYYKINNYMPTLEQIKKDLENKYINKNINDEFIENFCLGNLGKRFHMLAQICNE